MPRAARTARCVGSSPTGSKTYAVPPPTATRRRCSRLVTSAGRDRPCGLQARDAAGDRNVRVAGGGETILEYLNAGLVDEFSITLSPVLFGSGTRLFDGVDATRIALDPVRTDPSPTVTHLTYAVRAR